VYKLAMSKLLVLLLLFSASTWARKPISGSRFEQLSGKKMIKDQKSKWDQRYSRRSFIYGKTPAKFLAENYNYIPYGSTILDMGMGEGRNAVFLAQKGYKVTGIDISSVAVKKARLLAKEFGVKIQTVVASMEKYKISPNSFDAIICFYYVDRKLVSKMMSWLKPGGILIYEAHTMAQRSVPEYKNEPVEHFLKEQELLKLFKNMRVLKYEEPVHTKEFSASIILEKKQG
jgi:tellurite methyltransferase